MLCPVKLRINSLKNIAIDHLSSNIRPMNTIRFPSATISSPVHTTDADVTEIDSFVASWSGGVNWALARAAASECLLLCSLAWRYAVAYYTA